MAIAKGQADADSGLQEVAATPETWFCSDPAQGKLQRPSLGSIPDPSLPEINTNPASPAWVQEETSQQTQHHACHPCALLPLHATSCALEYKSARKRVLFTVLTPHKASQRYARHTLLKNAHHCSRQASPHRPVSTHRLLSLFLLR